VTKFCGGPRAEVGAFRIRKMLGKASTAVGKALWKMSVEVTSEAAKKVPLGGNSLTMPTDRLEHERALERDAVQFTKDFSLFVLRTCVILHGGAIVALLSLLGTIITHEMVSSVISLTAVRIAIGVFALGLVLTAMAGVCGYFNFLVGQARDVPPARLAKNMQLSRRWRVWATTLTAASLVVFVAGVVTVIIPW